MNVYDDFLFKIDFANFYVDGILVSGYTHASLFVSNAQSYEVGK